MKLPAAIMLPFLFAACQNGTTPQLAAPPAEDTVPSLARVQALEQEIQRLVDTTGCSTEDACRTAPVGARPCGGPREYVVYCATTTDTAALFARLAELKRVEEARNRETGMASTCIFLQPPETELVGGSCRATRAGFVEPQPSGSPLR